MSIEGIPDGWEPVRFDYVNIREYWLGGHGEVCEHLDDKPTQVKRLIIRKIEKPRQYRPFANAAEYAPHFDRSLQPGAVLDVVMRVLKYDEAGIFVITGMGLGFVAYEDAFHGFKFTDGTPFGIEVTE